MLTAQEGIPRLQWLPNQKNCLNWPKAVQYHPKMPRSALTGGPIAVTLMASHSILIIKVAPRPQKQPELAKKRLKPPKK